MENDEVVDQRRATVEAFLARHGEVLKRQGVVVATFRHRDGRRLGPYYRLVCRTEGRQISVYLGPPGPLVEDVRRRVAALQAPLVAARRRGHVRLALRRQAAVARRELDAELKPRGLYRKGNEVRGWRTWRTIVRCLGSKIGAPPDHVEESPHRGANNDAG